TEFCRTDRTREMCRKCVFLPDCTSFASCPWVDAHCEEAHRINALSNLKQMLDQRADQTEEPDEDETVC
ncbi:MAG: hypothetical protein II412_01990, partial [Clostridia bacterium]|nr:hypothetical protein [Clostridia bacterium]